MLIKMLKGLCVNTQEPENVENETFLDISKSLLDLL